MMQTKPSDSNTLLVDPNDYDKHIKAMADACTQFFNAGLPITYCLQLNKIRTELECDKAHLEDIKAEWEAEAVKEMYEDTYEERKNELL